MRTELPAKAGAPSSPPTKSGAPRSIAELDAAVATQRENLQRAKALLLEHRARRQAALARGDKKWLVDEASTEDNLKVDVEIAEYKISELESHRAELTALEAAEQRRRRRDALLKKIETFQRNELTRAEEAIAALAQILPAEEALYSEIIAFNAALPAEEEAIGSPEATLRHAPAVPARQEGTRKVQKNRLRPGHEHSPTSGAHRYEVYEEEEPVIIPEVPPFRPAPLYRTTIVSSFRRDGPSYSPRGVLVPAW
jgi:hypothetical protein